jgi:hypothetical protein
MDPTARQEELVDQIVFRWDTENSLGTTGFGPVAWSCERDTAGNLFSGVKSLLRTTASETVPALVRVERQGSVLLVHRSPRLDPDGHSGAVCHALYGSAKILDPETCLGLYDWEWEGSGLPLGDARGRLEPVRVADLLPSAEAGGRALLATPPKLEKDLTAMAAEMLRHPRRRFTVLDRQGGDSPCRMLWGLYGIFSELIPGGWTFATHDTEETPATRFVFVRRWPGPAPQGSERLRTDPEDRPGDPEAEVAARLVGHYLRRVAQGEGQYDVAQALKAVSGPRSSADRGAMLRTAEAALENLAERAQQTRLQYESHPSPRPYQQSHDQYAPDETPEPRAPHDRPETWKTRGTRGTRDPDESRGSYTSSGSYGEPYASSHPRSSHSPRAPHGTPESPGWYGPAAPGEAPPLPKTSDEWREPRHPPALRRVPPEWPAEPPAARLVPPVRLLLRRRKPTVAHGQLLTGLRTLTAPNTTQRDIGEALRGSSDSELVAAVRENGLHYADVTKLVKEIAGRYGEWSRELRHQLCDAVLKKELFLADRSWPVQVGLPSGEVLASNAAALYGWAVAPLAGESWVGDELVKLLPRLSTESGPVGRAAIEQILAKKGPGPGREVWLAIVRAAWRESTPTTARGENGRPTMSGPYEDSRRRETSHGNEALRTQEPAANVHEPAAPARPHEELYGAHVPPGPNWPPAPPAPPPPPGPPRGSRFPGDRHGATPQGHSGSSGGISAGGGQGEADDGRWASFVAGALVLIIVGLVVALVVAVVVRSG